MCHRDLKPDNIMLALKEGQIKLKLIDFNIAYDYSESPMMEGAEGLRMWSAPETRKHAGYTNISDLWSVGCILYFLCTGYKLFSEEDYIFQEDKVKNATIAYGNDNL